MLVLSRKVNERILIGDNIVVTVNTIKGDRVQLGIDAPTEIPVKRAELPPRDATAAPPRALVRKSKRGS